MQRQLDAMASELQQLRRQMETRWMFPKISVMLGKTDEAITKGSVGTVSRYIGSDVTEDDSGTNVECKNRFADVDTGKWVAYVKIDGFHYLIAAECD